jgi:hypothetical protein
MRQRDIDRLEQRVLNAQADALNMETSISMLVPQHVLQKYEADNPTGGRTLPLRFVRLCEALRDYADRNEWLEKRLAEVNRYIDAQGCTVCGLVGHKTGDPECDGPHGGFKDPNCTAPYCATPSEE